MVVKPALAAIGGSVPETGALYLCQPMNHVQHAPPTGTAVQVLRDHARLAPIAVRSRATRQAAEFYEHPIGIGPTAE
jgi:hypothetical protein